VQSAYNKVQRTQQMVAVSQELLATRQEARRASAQQLERGAYLRSQADAAIAQRSKRKRCCCSRNWNSQAQDELTNAIGQRHSDCNPNLYARAASRGEVVRTLYASMLFQSETVCMDCP